jgi:formiminotetrahydrofolate cyclodeaminase
MFSELSISEFISRLASDSPTPGGGSASAISGAMGAALLSMVSGIALKGSSESVEIEEKRNKCYRISQEFIVLSDEDTKAFNEVLGAYRLSKVTEEDKEKRKQAIQISLKSATLVPLTVMRKVNELSFYLEEIHNFLIESTKSDFLCALILIESAIKGAFYNVQINLKSVKDSEFVSKTTDEAKGIYESFINKINKFEEYAKSKIA